MQAGLLGVAMIVYSGFVLFLSGLRRGGIVFLLILLQRNLPSWRTLEVGHFCVDNGTYSLIICEVLHGEKVKKDDWSGKECLRSSASRTLHLQMEKSMVGFPRRQVLYKLHSNSISWTLPEVRSFF